MTRRQTEPCESRYRAFDTTTHKGESRGKNRYSSSWGELHLRATGRHLPYGITQCYLAPDTSERAPPNPSHAGWYSIYLPRRDGKLSWPTCLDSAPAGSRTNDLSITSPTLNHCTTKTQTPLMTPINKQVPIASGWSWPERTGTEFLGPTSPQIY